MSVKIKVSYNTDQELQGVVKLLAPALESCKISRNREGNREGRYKKAYILLKENEVIKSVSDSEHDVNHGRTTGIKDFKRFKNG